MPHKLRILAILTISLAFISTLPLMVTAQGDTTPTPTNIPILGEETEESSAPTGPNIVPPTISAETTSEPVATRVPGAETTEDALTGASVCPIAVQEAFTATEILCTDIASGEACIGNGTVDSVFGADVEGLNFSQSNDRVRLTSLDQMNLVSGTAWTVVRTEIELATTDGGDIATATLFAYGNLTLVDTGRTAAGGAQSGTIIAGSGLNVRRNPGSDGVVVWQLQGGEQVTVTGITADDQWIRIVIPNEFAGTGWVYAPYIEVEGGVDSLPTVTENLLNPDLAAPEFAPGQSFELLSANTSETCGEDVPDSGLLLQSPSGTPDALRIEINGVEIQVNGTVLIQAQADAQLRVHVLEGQATIIANDTSVSANVNERLTVALDSNLVVTGTPQSEPFSPEELASIPVRLLPRPIAFGIAPVDVETSGTGGFGTPQPATMPDACTLTAPDAERNVRGGPSTEYPVVLVLQPNDSVTAVGQAIGELNLTWYQTDTGGWIREDTVNSEGDCSALPVVEPPPLPEPTSTPDGSTASDGNPSLSSSTLAALTCDGSTITGSTTSDGTETSVAIGGTWTVAAGTTVTFTTQGGLLRPEFGDYIQLIAADGTVIAGSDEGRSLTVPFDADSTFEARFSAANGDTVVMAASCS